MRVALAQIDTTVADIGGNVGKVESATRRAASEGVDLVAFPELTLTGYPPQDLLERRSFIRANLQALDRLASGSGKTAMVIGFAEPTEEEGGKPLYNAAAVLHEGRKVGVARKGLLPTYDVFDEARHFRPAREFAPIPLFGRKMGVTICEDIWNSVEKGPRLYDVDPAAALVREGADWILNISASPYSLDRPRQREARARIIATAHGVPVVMVNLVGGNDSLVFDGTSFALGPDGRPIGRARSFQEDLAIFDLCGDPSPDVQAPPAGEEEVIGALVLGLKDYAAKCGFRSAILGLSGGIDSSVVCAIAARALGPSKVMGIAMPGPYSSPRSLEDARSLARGLGIHLSAIPITEIFEEYRRSLAPEFPGEPMDVAEENMQARVRGNLLMALSNRYGHLLLSTGNKSEMAVGYCTLYGDLSGGLAVISDVPKTLVYSIARHLEIPASIIERAPSAELRPDQTDQDALPPYEILDEILKGYIEDNLDPEEIIRQGHDPSLVREIIDRVDRNEYKRRQAPPGLRITTKAFGSGRRLPIARGDLP